MPEGEVVVTCLVELTAEEAFATFTEEIDRWWVRRPPSGADAVVRFEGGRLVAVTEDGTERLATVLGWDPPTAITMEWRGPHAQSGDVVTVDFRPDAGGTRVTVRHRRAGLRPPDAAAAVIGLWWGDLLRGVAWRVGQTR